MPAARAFCASRAISSSIFLPTTIIRSASSSITTTIDGSRSSGSGASGVRLNGFGRDLAALGGICDLAVVAGELAHAELAEQLVAPLHLADTPVERVGRLLHVGDHGGQQVRDAFVDAQLEHLRVDEDHAHVARLGLVQQAQDHRVDADRLARAGGAGHQAVRHLRQIGDHRRADDVLAEAERELRRGVVVGRRAEDLGQANDLPLRVRQLERHRRAPGDRLDHADRHQAERAREVLRQVDDLRALHAGRGLDLVARDHRARRRGDDAHVDTEVLQLLLDQARRHLQRLGRDRLDLGRAPHRADRPAAAWCR